MAMLQMLRGSDVDFRMIWPGTGGTPFDLTGWSVAPFEAHERLSANLTLEIGDAAVGEILGRIEWDDAYTNGAIMGFRVQISSAGTEYSTPRLSVNVK